MDERPREHLKSILSKFDTAMLVTRTPAGELRSRPMTIADLEGDGELWFATSIDTGKVNELLADNHVNISFQSDKCFVSVAGFVDVVRDRAKIEELWRDTWKPWFPEGKNDPELALLRVRPDFVEYWDMTGAKGVRYAWEVAKAYVRGSKPHNPQGTHASVKLH